jgi:hypothetical protein
VRNLAARYFKDPFKLESSPFWITEGIGLTKVSFYLKQISSGSCHTQKTYLSIFMLHVLYIETEVPANNWIDLLRFRS